MDKKKKIEDSLNPMQTIPKVEYVEVHPGSGKCLIYAIQEYADAGYRIVTSFGQDGVLMGREVPTAPAQPESKIPDKEKKVITGIPKKEVSSDVSEEDQKRKAMLERLAKARAARGKKKESNK